MGIYKLFLTQKQIVTASITDRDDDMLMGEVDVELENLGDLIEWMQIAVDSSLIMLSQQANEMGLKPNNNGDLN